MVERSHVTLVSFPVASIVLCRVLLGLESGLNGLAYVAEGEFNVLCYHYLEHMSPLLYSDPS